MDRVSVNHLQPHAKYFAWESLAQAQRNWLRGVLEAAPPERQREALGGDWHQPCAFHKVQDIGSHLEERKHRKEIVTEAASIYRAPNPGEAKARAGDWAERWRDKEPQAVRAFLIRWERTLIYYRFEPRLWGKLRTTNSPYGELERYPRELRRRLKSISAYRNEASIDRMVYLAMRDIATREYPHASHNKFTHSS